MCRNTAWQYNFLMLEDISRVSQHRIKLLKFIIMKFINVNAISVSARRAKMVALVASRPFELFELALISCSLFIFNKHCL